MGRASRCGMFGVDRINGAFSSFTIRHDIWSVHARRPLKFSGPIRCEPALYLEVDINRAAAARPDLGEEGPLVLDDRRQASLRPSGLGAERICEGEKLLPVFHSAFMRTAVRDVNGFRSA